MNCPSSLERGAGMGSKFYAPGVRFGLLTVVENLATRNGKGMLRCRCDCGNLWEGRVDAIKARKNASCGCQRSLPPRRDKHGMSRTKLYGVWRGMHSRCGSPKDANYSRYGQRGISVCQEWNDATEFLSWALKNGYAEGLQLDRIDNEKGYSPENCRFVTRKENCRNTRRNRYITIGSETKTLTDWAERTGTSLSTLRYRLSQGKVDDIKPLGSGEW